MKKMKHCARLIAILLAAALFGGAAAHAAGEIESETDSAAAYLAGREILEGDENGKLNLDGTLTRAELAAILTRLDFAADGGLDEWDSWGKEHFSDPENRYSAFTDVPGWALPYAEYCYQRGLMKGVSETKFDQSAEVSPKMICAVILRYRGIAETDWGYDTSVEKARELGIAPGEGLDGAAVTRGVVAVVVRRGMEYAEDKAAAVTPAEPLRTEPESAPQETALGEAPATTIGEMKAEIVRLTNEEREKAGLSPLEVLPELMDCAQAKAQDFLDNGYYGHISPKYGTAAEMIKGFIVNALTAAENIGLAKNTPEEIFSDWIASPGHRDIILTKRLTHIGVGIVKGSNGYAWVQQFVKL